MIIIEKEHRTYDNITKYNLYLTEDSGRTKKTLLENVTAAEMVKYDPENIKRRYIQQYARRKCIMGKKYLFEVVKEYEKDISDSRYFPLCVEWDRTVNELKEKIIWCRKEEDGVKRCINTEGHLKLVKVRMS